MSILFWGPLRGTEFDPESQEDHPPNKGSVEDGYLRFFYFSIVTITTLGYGDIVPVTERARMLLDEKGLFLSAILKLATHPLRRPAAFRTLWL